MGVERVRGGGRLEKVSRNLLGRAWGVAAVAGLQTVAAAWWRTAASLSGEGQHVVAARAIEAIEQTGAGGPKKQPMDSYP